jgi:hypothetical protein
MRKGLLGALAVSLLTGAIVGAGVVITGSPEPGAVVVTPSPTPYPSGWDSDPLPFSWGTTPPVPVAKRKVYVISSLSGWPVSSAMSYVDRYTGSDWVMSKTCPAGAYRCIFVKKDNRLSAPTIAATYCYSCSRVTIKVDTAYASHQGIRSSARKKYVLAHEFGHAAGIKQHSRTCRNLMYARTGCWSLRVSGTQEAIMRKK